MKKLTKKLTKIEAAKKFFDAVAAVNEAKNNKNVSALNASLDAAMIDYKISHSLNAACGLFDCMYHYNNNYAK